MVWIDGSGVGCRRVGRLSVTVAQCIAPVAGPAVGSGSVSESDSESELIRRPE